MILIVEKPSLDKKYMTFDVKHIEKSLDLSVFNHNKIYLATIKLISNKEKGQQATLKFSP